MGLTHDDDTTRAWSMKTSESIAELAKAVFPGPSRRTIMAIAELQERAEKLATKVFKYERDKYRRTHEIGPDFEDDFEARMGK